MLRSHPVNLRALHQEKVDPMHTFRSVLVPFSVRVLGALTALLAPHLCPAAEHGPGKSMEAGTGSVQTGQAFVPPILPPAGHPRLLLRSADLPEMKRRLDDPAFARFTKRAKSLSESGWNGELPVPQQFDRAPRNWMEWGRSSRGLAARGFSLFSGRLAFDNALVL
jgi:hypothetical protein